MNKFAEITVIQWLNGKNAETFESDNDFRTGTYGRELAGKVRISWDDTNEVEWVKSDKLRKLDKANFEYLSDTSDTSDTSDIIDIPEQTITFQVNADQLPKAARKPRTNAKKPENAQS